MYPDLPKQDSEEPYRGLRWIFIGPQGLRAGWSILLVVSLLCPPGQRIVLRDPQVASGDGGNRIRPQTGLLRRTFRTDPAYCLRRHRRRHRAPHHPRLQPPGAKPCKAFLQWPGGWLCRLVGTCGSNGLGRVAPLRPCRSAGLANLQVRSGMGWRLSSCRLL